MSTHAILLGAQLCFASLAVVGRMAVGHIPPNVVVATRIVGGMLAFATIAATRGVLARPRRADLVRLIACAFLGVVANQTLFLNGLAHSTATNGSLLGATAPVYAAVFAVLAGHERFSAQRAGGIALALAGAALLVGLERVSTDPAHLAGNVMIVVNAISYALFLVLVGPLAARYPPLGLIALLFVAGAVLITPVGVVAWAHFAPEATRVDAAFLAFLVAVPTVGAYGLTQVALARAEPSLVATYIYLQPVLATAGAALLLGEPIGPRTLAAAAMILAGVFTSSRARTTRTKA